MFQTIYLFHDQDSTANGTVLTLELLLRRMFPEVDYIRPMLIHQDNTVAPDEAYAYVRDHSDLVQPNSLIIGLGVGGLMAAKLQEDQPELQLTVVAISAPTRVGLLELKPGPHIPLYALFSSQDDVIFDRSNWSDFTAEAYDVAWLRSHKADSHKYSITRVLEAFLNGVPMSEAIENVFPNLFGDGSLKTDVAGEFHYAFPGPEKTS